MTEEQRLKRNAYMREYRQKNLEQVRANDRENYYRHKEARLEYKHRKDAERRANRGKTQKKA